MLRYENQGLSVSDLTMVRLLFSKINFASLNVLQTVLGTLVLPYPFLEMTMVKGVLEYLGTLSYLPSRTSLVIFLPRYLRPK